ncbi:MAG: FAD-dependent oxidoreductase [Oscillospiraceae bacterium]|nr:FAD-dependent oxidoreductase [Oscillospiraceae bacterium]
MKFKKYDVIIVGAGIAGLYTAIHLNRRLKVLLLSKRAFTVSNTALAQGGVAVDFNDIESHINDTLKAGKYENHLKNLRVLVEQGAENIEALIRLGVNFDRRPDGKLDLGLEGGHSRNRIAHCKDNTGYEIVTSLAEKVKTLTNIDFLENAYLLQLKKHREHFFTDVWHKTHYYYSAPIVVIATGGIGEVYKYTTNSEISTGDGLQFAFNLGAKIEQMNLIQFHPTAFAPPKKSDKESVLLITEAARGEGAKLLNANMEQFTDELAPRDVVSRSIIAEGMRIGSNDFYIDISHRDSDFVKTRFPMIYEKLLEKGYDLTKKPVPIFPCQHYLMGGIWVDSQGRTTVDGLYAVGECAFTGVHGANRLASNSLLEALVFSRSAAENINHIKRDKSSDSPLESGILSKPGTNPVPENLRDEIKNIMQKAFFVVYNFEESRKGLFRITEIKALLDNSDFALTPEFVEVKSLATTAYLILTEVMKNAA